VITNIEDFFTQGCGRCDRFATADCSTRQWASGLLALRKICVDAGLIETLKWAHPCYMHQGRNVALVGALRGDFRLNFFNAALMKDPAGILERQGPNTQHPDSIRFTANEQVAAMERTICAYLTEAMAYAEAGIKPAKLASEIELPPELGEALDADPELAAAFRGLSPGRQRSYVITLNSTKKPETRVARIATFREKIMTGKGALER
jgi:uncharacterized protein YdeI (YjbR/CyaY-like superfamily)